MFDWQDLIKTLGGEGMVLAAVGWLVKTLVSNRFARDAEAYKTQLKTSADAEIERLKNSLQIVALEHEVRFSKLHERRAQVIADLYKLLVEAPGVAGGYILDDPSDSSQAHIAAEKALELYRFVDLNRLYLPDSVCVLLEKFVNTLKGSVATVRLYWTQVKTASPKIDDKRSEVLLKACEVLETELPALRKQLEIEFRSLLGVKQESSP